MPKQNEVRPIEEVFKATLHPDVHTFDQYESALCMAIVHYVSHPDIKGFDQDEAYWLMSLYRFLYELKPHFKN